MFASSAGETRFRTIARPRTSVVISTFASVFARTLAFRRGHRRARSRFRRDVRLRRIDVTCQIDRFAVQLQVGNAADQSSMHDARPEVLRQRT